MSASNARGASASHSSSTDWGQSLASAPLVECPNCRVQLVRIVSKQEKSKGQTFIKCPNNIKGDPTTCGIIMSESQYVKTLGKTAAEKEPIPPKMLIHSSGTDFGPCSEDRWVELKQEIDEMKGKIDSAVNELWQMKVQIEKVKMEFVVIAALCVGVAAGCVLSKMF